MQGVESVASDIVDSDMYLSDMAKSFPDKDWFVKYVSPEIDTIVDFGGGSGEFCEYVKAKHERIGKEAKFIVIENNEVFAASARLRGFRTFHSFNEMLSSGEVDLGNSLLVMSSVLHEVYSYATGSDDISRFWSDVAQCGFRQMAIRDMSLDFNNLADVPSIDIVHVYENVFRNPDMEIQGTKLARLVDEFEGEWGALCDPRSVRVNVRNLLHFLNKYRYVANWERELHEDYLPITQDELELILTGMGYGFVKKDSSKLPFYVEAWANDFNLLSADADRHKIVFLSWLKTLNTHIKWLVEK